MPPRGLPGNANLEQLKNGARSFQRAVRAGDAGAAEVVREFHPRLGQAQPGSPELAAFKLADAQLVVARSFNFPSWAKLKAYIELTQRYSRSPAAQPVGEPAAGEHALVDEFLRLACLNYGNDDAGALGPGAGAPHKPSRARDRDDSHDRRGRRGGRRPRAARSRSGGSEPARRALRLGAAPVSHLLSPRPHRTRTGRAGDGARAARPRRGPERRLPVGGPQPAVHRADRGVWQRRGRSPGPSGRAGARAVAARGRRRSQRRADSLQPPLGQRRPLARAAVRIRARHRRRRTVAPAARSGARDPAPDGRRATEGRGPFRVRRPCPAPARPRRRSGGSGRPQPRVRGPNAARGGDAAGPPRVRGHTPRRRRHLGRERPCTRSSRPPPRATATACSDSSRTTRRSPSRRWSSTPTSSCARPRETVSKAWRC